MQNNIRKIQQKLQQIKLTLPAMVGTQIVNFSKQRFREQAWVDTSTEPWKKRSAKAKRNKGRAILTDTGRLKRSIRIVRSTADSVVVGSDVPYAAVHNDGFNGSVNVKAHRRRRFRKEKVATGKITKKGKASMKTVKVVTGESEVKAHTKRMRMPRRRFLGASQVMRTQVKRLIQSQILKAFK